MVDNSEAIYYRRFCGFWADGKPRVVDMHKNVFTQYGTVRTCAMPYKSREFERRIKVRQSLDDAWLRVRSRAERLKPLVEAQEKARAAKNWAEADRLRVQIANV
jgi:cysteinyl-tRNA synthetase